MRETFEILLIQGGVLVKHVQGADPYLVGEKTAGFIRKKYGETPGKRS
jgi:hypothetical protein